MLRAVYEVCHLWLQRDLERSTISANWSCLNLSVGVRMAPRSDWQELPVCSNSL